MLIPIQAISPEMGMRFLAKISDATRISHVGGKGNQDTILISLQHFLS